MSTYMQDIVSDTGKSVTLKKQQSSDVNKWGDRVNGSFEEVTIEAVVQDVSQTVEESSEGDIKDGEVNIYVDGGVSDISEGVVFDVDGQEYRADDVQKRSIAGESHYEVRALVQ